MQNLTKRLRKVINAIKYAKPRTKRRLKFILFFSTAIIAIILTILLIRLGYNFSGTGFNGSTETIKPGQQTQPSKTLWDWTQLLLVPFILIIGAFILNLTVTRNEQKTAKKRFKLEHKIAVSTQQENLLQTYLDRMTELLLNKNLRTSELNSDVRYVAQARTSSVIYRLDGDLQKNLLEFLRDTSLIKNNKEGSIISLEGIQFQKSYIPFLNLTNSNLSGIYMHECTLPLPNFSNSKMDNAAFYGCGLREANFCGTSFEEGYLSYCELIHANLSNANLHKINLAFSDSRYANLSNSNLSNADLSNADLSNADLTDTNLKDAILDKTIVTQEQLHKTKYYSGKGI